MADKDLISLFEEQFVRVGDGWWFRARRNGPAIPVSDTERDLFITGLTQSLEHTSRQLLHYGLGSMILLFAAALLWPDTVAARFSMLLFGLAAFWALFRAVHENISFKAPAMALANRSPVAPAAEPPSRVYEISKDLRLNIWAAPVLSVAIWLVYLGSTPKHQPGPVLLMVMGSVLLFAWLAVMFRPRLQTLKQRWSL